MMRMSLARILKKKYFDSYREKSMHDIYNVKHSRRQILVWPTKALANHSSGVQGQILY